MNALNDQKPGLSPVRRRGAPVQPKAFDDAEVARGQSDAVLGALGRMQLRLDLLAREQGEALDQIYAALERIGARLDDFESSDVVTDDVPATIEQPVEGLDQDPAPRPPAPSWG
jgi:hypothetical protein